MNRAPRRPDLGAFASCRHLTLVLLAITLLVTTPASAVAQAAAAETSVFDRARVDAVVERFLAEEPIPGVAVAVVRGEDVLLADGYGMASLELSVPVGPKTMFQSGSLGKMFTAAGVMLLVEDGRLDLDSSVRRWIPEGPESWEPITLRNLLSHTSGIPDYTTDDFDYTREYSEEDLVRMAGALPLEFPPGSRWNYSNTGYVLLGIIIGRAAGEPYWELLRERLWDPAGVPTMRVNVATDIVPHRAAGYEVVDDEYRNQEWVAPSLNTTADGSLLMSLEDMIAWNQAVRTRAVLTPESWQTMLSPVVLASGNTFPYGFGWGITTLGSHRVERHGGGWQGFRTHFLRFPDEDLAIIVLANSAEAETEQIAEAVAAAVDPALAAPPPPDTPIADPAPEVTAFVATMLAKAADPGLDLADFAFVRQTSFPYIRDSLRERLDGLAAPDRLELLERRQLGDDTVLIYRAVYGERSFRVRAAIAPEGGLTALRVREIDAEP